MSSAATAMRVKVETGGKKADLSTSKLKSVSGTHNHGVKGKAVATATKTTTTTTAVKAKSTKKVYTLPGQKYDVPEEREPLRIFYESLSQQIPTSEMAEFWMMEHGLLPPDKAKKAYERKQRKQHQLRTGTPVKPHKPPHKPERPESSKSHLLKNTNSGSKKRHNYSDSEEEFIVKHKKSKF
ncbi:hypothetical protein KSP39_PZI015722 [Platanthera zijinensis]|uniref:Uncharacterized protein n=1 Tax=Platanthera zijinensis TaxID=2320716 RepID=A0AAP0BB55_9ASPA